MTVTVGEPWQKGEKPEDESADFEEAVLREFDAAADFPWESDTTDEVLRHRENRKWFALVIELPQKRLGLEGEGTVTAFNLKCDPCLIGSLRDRAGIYPAYHRNKEHWITVLPDSALPEDELMLLVRMSYELTAEPKRRKPRESRPRTEGIEP